MNATAEFFGCGIESKNAAREGQFRAKAFAGEGVKLNRFRLDPDGTLRCWDSVAGHYTTCHSVSERAARRLRRLLQQKGDVVRPL